MTLSWTAPADNGGSDITDYILRYTEDGTNWNVFNDGLSTATSGIVTGLTNGQAYNFKIAAVNAAGRGTNSTQVTSTPSAVATVPSAPVNPSATRGNQHVLLAWESP